MFQLDVLWSLVTGRLVREKVDPAVQSAVDSQVIKRKRSSIPVPSSLSIDEPLRSPAKS
jgi:hypothetical protein